jgi:hypothetical protein
MRLSEEEIAELIRNSCFDGPSTAIWYLRAAHAIAERLAEHTVFHSVTGVRFIATPTLDCDWLELLSGPFEGRKIAIKHGMGLAFDGQAVEVTVRRIDAE